MFEKIVQLDRDLMVYLNNLGSEPFDSFWLLSTHQKNWIPFFLLLLVIIYIKKGLKNTILIIIIVSLLILVGDQTANLVKNTVQRLRPCNDLALKDSLRILYSTPSFGYFSGHATNSMSTTLLIFLVLRRHYKYLFMIFLWPIIFAYSRIYVGVHFPLDIVSGYLFGASIALLFYKLYCFIVDFYFPQFKIGNLN